MTSQTHIHRPRPVDRRIDISGALRAAQPDADNMRRCQAEPGDLVYIVDRCRCGSERRTPAMVGLAGVPVALEVGGWT